MSKLRRSGFSLVELLCVMALLALAGMVLTMLLRDTLRVEKAQADSFDQMLHRSALADQFRADVGQAEKVLEEWGEFTDGADTLILKMGKNRHVLYRWQANELHRHVFEGLKDFKRTLPMDTRVAAVEFSHGAGLVRLRLRTMHAGKSVPGRTVEIVAALTRIIHSKTN